MNNAGEPNRHAAKRARHSMAMRRFAGPPVFSPPHVQEFNGSRSLIYFTSLFFFLPKSRAVMRKQYRCEAPASSLGHFTIDIEKRMLWEMKNTRARRDNLMKR